MGDKSILTKLREAVTTKDVDVVPVNKDQETELKTCKKTKGKVAKLFADAQKKQQNVK